MGFSNGTFAKVWEIINPRENITRMRISTSTKNKDTGSYEQDFGGFCVLYGTALAKKANALKPGDRIKLTRTDVRNRYDRETKKEYTDFIIWEFEPMDGSHQTSAAPPAADGGNNDHQYAEDDQTLPF